MYCKFNLVLQLSSITCFFVHFLNLLQCSISVSLKNSEENLNSSKSYNQLNHSLSLVLPLLTRTSVVCVYAENLELLTIFGNIIINVNIQVVYYSVKSNFQFCNVFVALGDDSCHNRCGLFTNFSGISIYFSNSLMETNVSSLEPCFHNIFSPDVVIVSLLDHSVYELSPVVPQPRFFTRSSIVEVKKHQEQARKLNLAGTVLPVATMNYIPYFIIKDKDKGAFDGVEELLISEMASHLNFTPSYQIFTSWGVLMPNGTWVTQIGGAMQEGRAEVAISNFWQIHSVFSVMDFGPSMTKVKLGFLVRRPEKVAFQWRTVYTIFKIWVWLFTLLTLILVVIVYWAGVNYGTRPQSESWVGSVMTVFGHLTMSTSHRRVDDGSTRYALTSWSVFSLLLTTILSTGIVARLALPQYTERVDTIRQMVKGHFYWSVDYYKRFKRNKQMREFLFDFEDPWVNAFEKTYIHLESQEIIKRMQIDRKFAIPVQKCGESLMVLDTPGLLEHKALKNYRFSKETVTGTHSSIGVKKNSPLLEPLTILNLKILETGLIDHWKLAVIRRWPQYDSSHLSEERDISTFGEPRPLVLHTVRPVFYLLLFGLAVAFLVFVVEVNW